MQLHCLIQSILSIISVSYFLIVALWLLPQNVVIDQLLAPVRPFFFFFHLDQRWAFYAHFDRKTNCHYSGELTFDDGTVMIVEPPRLDKLSYFEGIRKEKSIVLFTYYLGNQWDYHDCAKYLTRPFENSLNPPKYLSLNKFWSDIPVPGSNSLYSREHPPPHDQMTHLFTYDLKKASEK